MRKNCILIVDDEENVVNSLVRLLKQENYDILTARNAQEALDKLRTKSVSLVMTDQRMPGMTGLELLKETKQLYPETMRMVLTGFTDLDVVVKAINEGEVYRFVTKPWEDEGLKNIIRQVMFQYNLLVDNKILLNMVRRQRKTISEIEDKCPEAAQLHKKEEVYEIEDTGETLEDFVQRYFPGEKDKGE